MEGLKQWAEGWGWLPLVALFSIVIILAINLVFRPFLQGREPQEGAEEREQ